MTEYCSYIVPCCYFLKSLCPETFVYIGEPAKGFLHANQSLLPVLSLLDALE